jgi:hypothetical protein
MIFKALKKEYAAVYLPDLAKRLGISVSTIRVYASLFGLKKVKICRGRPGEISSEGIENGYAVLYFYGTRHAIRKNRYLMEQHLGRKLTRKEVVHHINGIKLDNRLENLMLLPDESAHYQWHQAHPEVGEYNPHRELRKFTKSGLLQCSRCEKYYLESGFKKDTQKKLGVSFWCKKCSREYDREAYLRRKKREAFPEQCLVFA